MKNFIKIRHINTALLVATFLVLAFGLELFTQAQTPAPAAPTLDVTNVCQDRVVQFMEEKRAEFGAFMNIHFRSAKPTSELITDAVARFGQYRKEIRAYARSFVPDDKRFGTGAVAENTSCNAAIEDDFARVKELIRNHITESAYAKKSTRLLDKYKSINDQLQRLNFTIAQTYGYFGALSQKLPCYATQCVKL